MHIFGENLDQRDLTRCKPVALIDRLYRLELVLASSLTASFI